MAQTALVNEAFEAGEWLVKAIRDAGEPVRAVFWLYHSSEERWRLVVEATEVFALGPWEFAQSLHDAVSKMEDTQMQDAARNLLIGPVLITTRPHPVAEALRGSLGKAKSVFRTRLRNTMVGNYLVEDAVVYQLELNQAHEK